MTERSRPTGPDQMAEDGLKLAGRLAIGLASLPLIGLALLSRGKTTSAAEPEQEHDREGSKAADLAQEVVASGSTALPDAGPPQAEIDMALRRLAEATMPRKAHSKPGRAKGQAAAPVEQRLKGVAVRVPTASRRPGREAEPSNEGL